MNPHLNQDSLIHTIRFNLLFFPKLLMLELQTFKCNRHTGTGEIEMKAPCMVDSRFDKPVGTYYSFDDCTKPALY
jgi:hypothetical protein